MNIKNIINAELVKPVLMLTSIFYFDPALAGLYKCEDTDKKDTVIYSDKPCLKTSPQKLDIVVPPVDKASAERLKYYQKKKPPVVKKNPRVTVIKPQKPNKKCEAYAKQIKQIKKQSNSGYTSAQGESLRHSIKQFRKMYNKNCK